METETENRVIPHPSDHELGYIVGGGEYSMTLTDKQREEIKQYEDAGIPQPEVDQFVREIASAEIQARRTGKLVKAILLHEDAITELGTIIREDKDSGSTGEKETEGWGSFMLSGGEATFKEKPYLVGESNGLHERKKIEAKLGPDMAQVSFAQRLGSKEITLEGILLSGDLRGRGRGVALLESFMEGARRKGLKLVGTSTIRKPLIAKTLKEAGFRVDSRDEDSRIEATLLGETQVTQDSGEEDATVPVVLVNGNEEAVRRAVAESRSKDGRTFYVVANNPDDMVRGHSVSPEYQALHRQVVEEISALPDEKSKRNAIERRMVTLGVRWSLPRSKKRK